MSTARPNIFQKALRGIARRALGVTYEPWDNFLYTPYPGAMTKAGQPVNFTSAMRLSAVYACVRAISEAKASSSRKIFERDKTSPDKVTVVRDHDLYQLLYSEPNANQTAYEWDEMQTAHCCLRGNAYSYIERDVLGNVLSLRPLHPDRVVPKFYENGAIFYEVLDKNGQKERYSADKIMHFRGLSDDGLIGLGPLQIARETIGAALGVDEFSQRFIRNDATPNGILSTDIKIGANPEQTKLLKEQIRQQWQDANTGDSRGKIAVVDHGLKYLPISITPEDAQMMEIRKWGINEIARTFRMPPHKIGDLERSTNNNIEHQGIEFVTDCMIPWFRRSEQTINRSLFTPKERRRYFVQYDFEHLLRGDLVSMADAMSKLVLGGILVPNEGRKKFGFNPDPEGDKLLRPVNMVEAGAPPPAPAAPGAQPVKQSALESPAGVRNGTHA